MLVTGTGAARATLTENFAWAGIMLQAMTGNVGKSGTFVSLPETSSGPNGFQTYTLPSYTEVNGRIAAKYSVPVTNAFMKWAEAVIMRPKLDRGEITPAQYQQDEGHHTLLC